MDGQLLYTFLSIASTRDTPNGKMVPLEGMKLIAALAHKYDVPVTWIVDSQSVQESQNLLLQGHRECGDDVILLLDIPGFLRDIGITPTSKAEETVVLRQNLPEFISSERARIGEMLPWAELNVIAADVKPDALIEILEELDCIGIWNYHWVKEGCPWSFFYASREHHNAPAQHAGGLVAVENSSLNLNAAFHSGSLQVFSADPNALRMSGLYADRDIAYPKALLDEYLKNCSWNRFVVFLQKQSAYEMEYASYDSYDRGTISKIADIMSEFFHEVVYNPTIQPLSLPQAIKLYKREFEYTESCCMAFEGILPLQAEVDFYVPPEPKQRPPYPLTFFYYDRECQLTFAEGQILPIEMRNYFRPPFESNYYVEREMPSISSFRPTRNRDKLIMEFEIESIKQMPFGLAIWDDHSMFSLVSTNARLVKWIGTYLLFIGVDLEEGLNRIEVSLTI